MTQRADGGEPLRTAYADAVRTRGLTTDPAQVAALELLVNLQHRLREDESLQSRLARVFRWRRLGTRPPTVRGLYLWGAPGRGKTFIVDLFYATLPVPGRRLHFHHFMRDVHLRLQRLRRRPNPLTAVADQMAHGVQVICLDEMQVTDIADAMILYGLITALLRRGVCLIFTSNQPPGALYAGGLQRERFLPAIALLERELDVHELAGGTDFRLRSLQQAEIWLPSADPTTRARLDALFERLGGAPAKKPITHITLSGRRVPAVRAAHDIAWLTFHVLCEGPRSQADYIELASLNHTVIVADVPVMHADRDDAARRFIGLIDELYDSGVKLIVSAAADPAELYRGTRLAEVFQRTVSRLVEMRSAEYLARPHRSEG